MDSNYLNRLRYNLLPILILISIGAGVYVFNLNNQLFWDDSEWILGNKFVQDFKHLKEIFTSNVLTGFGLVSDYYRPFLMLTFAFNYVFGQDKPIGYHLVNNGLHITNGILIFFIVYSFFKKRAVPFITALLFIIHPLQIEAVTYIAGRGDPLSAFFMLLAIWLFIKFESNQIISLIPIILMVFALLSRETAVILPFLLTVIYVSFLSDGKFLLFVKTGLVKLWPYYTLSGLYVVLRLTVLNFKNTLNFYSQVNAYSDNVIYRLYTFGAVLIEYFKLIFAPVGLHMEREMAVRTSIFQWPVWGAVIIVAGIIYGGYFLYKKSGNGLGSIDSGQNFRVWLFGWSWFFIGLAPVSGIIPINAVMYEHWLYLPLIGFFVLAGFYLIKLADFLKSKNITIGYWLLAIGLFGYFGFLGYQSIQRNILWGKPIEFYQDILKYKPTSLRVINNLANEYFADGEFEKAEEYYKRSIKNESGIRFAQPYYNLGNIYREKGDDKTAIDYFLKAIEADPSFPFSYQNLSVIYAKQGELKKASDILEEYKKIMPNNPRVYYNLGILYIGQNNIKTAIDNLETGLKYAEEDQDAGEQITKLLNKLKNSNIIVK